MDNQEEVPLTSLSTAEGGHKRKKPAKQPTVKFSRRKYIPFLVVIYSGLAVAAWTIQCVLVKRPITTSSYHVHIQYDDSNSRLANCFKQNASSVCAFAAVNFIQYQQWRKTNLTLRQTLALANKGWTDSQVLMELLHPLTSKRHSSTFLWLAIVVHLLGGIIAPLQELFMSQETVKVSAVREDSIPQAKITDTLQLTEPNGLGPTDDGIKTVTLRSALSSIQNSDYHQYLWQEGESDCPSNMNGNNHLSVFTCMPTSQVEQYVESPREKANLTDFYVVQLPKGFDSGTISQFAPRINYSVHWDEIEGWGESNPYYAYTLSVCMPGDPSQTPFMHTRERQDFQESLYLMTNYVDGSYPKKAAVKITLELTVGFFELPNIRRGHQPGPLLQADPFPNCVDDSCQTHEYLYQDSQKYRPRQQNDLDEKGDSALEKVVGKGPLTLLTLALFGNSSYIALRSDAEHDASFGTYPTECPEYGPMMLLMNASPYCASDAKVSVIDWLNNFLDSRFKMTALNAAVFLANQAILTGPEFFDLYVYANSGVDVQKPTISTTNMIALSVLLAVFLSLLLAIALWGSVEIAWTDSLDSFAMTKLGGSVTAEPALYMDGVGKEGKRVNSFDLLPGFVGDAEPDALVGKLALGAKAPLRRKRLYHQPPDLTL